MAKIINQSNEPRATKFERVYEDEDAISIWKYDLIKNPGGPIEVEYKYKKGYVHPSQKSDKKFIKDLIKEQKKNATKK
jgi:hypothetical protein